MDFTVGSKPGEIQVGDYVHVFDLSPHLQATPRPVAKVVAVDVDNDFVGYEVGGFFLGGTNRANVEITEAP